MLLDIVRRTRDDSSVSQISNNLPTPAAGRTPGLIGLDWGTTSARAYLLDEAGNVLGTGPSGRGILAVTEHAATAQERGAAFEEEFERMCGPWLDQDPGLPVLASGMVGSNQGWVDVPYQNLPQDLNSLAGALVRVPTRRGRVHIVPGLLDSRALPQVMRGEETQILGILEMTADGIDAAGEKVIVLPGTHTKWVRVREASVINFLTVMTGEMYGLLTRHSILSRLARNPEAPAMDAFDRGVRMSIDNAADGGLLAALFSARTLPLTGRMPADHVNDYISGLMIGAEVASCVRDWLSSGADIPPGGVLLCGETQLCLRYQRALQQLGIASSVVGGDVVTHGLRRIAFAAGMLDEQTKGIS